MVHPSLNHLQSLTLPPACPHIPAGFSPPRSQPLTVHSIEGGLTTPPIRSGPTTSNPPLNLQKSQLGIFDTENNRFLNIPVRRDSPLGKLISQRGGSTKMDWALLDMKPFQIETKFQPKMVRKNVKIGNFYGLKRSKFFRKKTKSNKKKIKK